MCISYSGERPTMPQLLLLDIPQQVGANYFTFGIFLLNDKTGSRVSGLKQACQGNPDDVVLRILQEWMEGRGVPLTWESLIEALKNTKLFTLADKLKNAAGL